MFHKAPVFKLVGFATWLITALAAINVGLSAWGWDFFKQPWVQTNLQAFIVPLYYIIGIAGLISLVLYFLALFGGHCECCGKINSECTCK